MPRIRGTAAAVFVAAVFVGVAGSVGHPWAQFGHDSQHSGASALPAPPSLPSPAWKRTWPIAYNPSSFLSQPAVSSLGAVFVGGLDNRTYALDVATGDVLWTFPTQAPVQSSPALLNSPTPVGLLVIFGCMDGALYALRADSGALQWWFATRGPVVSSPVLTLDGAVCFGSLDFSVRCIDGASGKLLWQAATHNWVDASPVLSPLGVLVAGSLDYCVYGWSWPGGELLWVTNTTGFVDSSPAVSPAGDTVAVGSGDGRLHVLDTLTGAVRWQASVGGYVWGSPVFGLGLVVVGSVDSHVYALNATSGARVWALKTGSYVVCTPAIRPGPGGAHTLYVGSTDGSLYAADLGSGLLLWSVEVGGFVNTVSLGAGGVVIVGSVNATGTQSYVALR